MNAVRQGNLTEEQAAKRRATGRRALVVGGVRGDTRRYRVLHLIEQLRLLGIEAVYCHLSDPRLDAAVRQPWHLAVFHRVAFDRHAATIIESLKARGTVVLADYDDLIFDPAVFQFINGPDFQDRIRVESYQAIMRSNRRTLEICEGATASTGYLAGQIAQLGKPVWVHRNAFSLEMLAQADRAYAAAGESRAGRNRVVIGYASGTPTHNKDFERVRPALRRVLETFPQAELALVGPLDSGEDWGTVSDRVRTSGLVPWRSLPEVLAQFDINLAPLVTDNPFAQSKSEIKYMEAAMAGTPTVASPTDAFQHAICSGENGLLAGTEEEWYDAVARLTADPELRRSMGERARMAVLAAYHPAVRAAQLADRLEEIFTTLRGVSFWEGPPPGPDEIKQAVQAAQARGAWIDPEYEQDPTHAQLGLYSLRHLGLKPTLMGVWLFLRRLAAPLFPFKPKD